MEDAESTASGRVMGAMMLTLVAGAACLFPAWHASQMDPMDPMEALRQE
jgi:ABC-type lipoprotein release transport system permease subunit